MRTDGRGLTTRTDEEDGVVEVETRIGNATECSEWTNDQEDEGDER
jgi:hypothetical protein